MGRPCLYNEQRADAICRAIERLGFFSVAAEINGIHRNTLTVWLERGDNGEEPFASFAERVYQSRAKWHRKQLRKVTDPCWLLERSDHAVFGRRDKTEHEHSGSIALELADLEQQSTAELKGILREALNEQVEGDRDHAKTESDT